MNSFTSISRPPSAADRGRTFLFLGVLFALLAAAAGFVAVADPYGRFHQGNEANPKLGARTNLALLTFIRLAKLPVDETRRAQVVILGDSRADKLTRTRLVHRGPQTILNLAIGGSSFEEMLSAYEWRERQRPDVRLVIVTVPFERFAAAPLPNRCLEARPLADSALRYLLNWEMLSQSWESWPPQRASSKAASAAETEEKAAGAVSPQQAKMVRGTWKRLYAAYDRRRADERLAALRRFVSSVHERGAQVVFWLPPLHEDIRALTAAAHLEPERERLLAALRTIAPTVDLTATPGLGGREFTFTDPVHTADGSAILDALLGHSPSGADLGAAPRIEIP